MDYRFMGNTGVKVSGICLGTMMFGGPTLFHLKRIQLNPSASIQTVLDAFARALDVDPRKDDAAGSLS